MTKKTVIIFGGAAGSKITKDIFELRGIDVIAFANNFLPKHERESLGAPVISYEEGIDLLLTLEKCTYFVATGNNFLRKTITADIIGQTDILPCNAIHPTAVISKTAKLGTGILIMPHATINASSAIGDGCIINTGSIIEHDNVIEDYAQISPGVALGGYVTVKTLAEVGLNASVLPHKTIGESSIIGSNSAVITDVEAYTVYAGNPAVYKKDVPPNA